MMLEHLELAEHATRLDDAISQVYAAGQLLTADQGGSSSTDAFADAVIQELQRS